MVMQSIAFIVLMATMYSLAKSNYPWYGIDYIRGQATGRFCNGRTIGDIISESLGFHLLLRICLWHKMMMPFLKESIMLLGEQEFSMTRACTFKNIERLSFDDQIDSFQKSRETIKAKIGEEAAKKLINESLFFIGIANQIHFYITGSNDYVNNYLQPFLADAEQYTHDEFIGLLASTLEKQLTVCYEISSHCDASSFLHLI
ncbi:hypothetical protein RJ641_023133 [Dillenia turbinata]|uniref:Uncharacterized protein n=1 Tax=Dillenia turbinata TaxID=194707 RepID=A0AAN8YUU5_9MAGN